MTLRRFSAAAAAVLVAAVVCAAAGAGGRARSDFHLVFDGKHTPALLHEGPFTTSASFCQSGFAEDLSVEAGSETARRQFRCSGSSGEFVALISPLPAEHGGIGTWQIVDGSGPLKDLRGKGTWSSTRLTGRSDDPSTITFESSWNGVVDFDTDPPAVAVVKSTAKKLRRPKSTYGIHLSLALGDAGGGTVSYQLEIKEPRTGRGLVFRLGKSTAASIALSLRVKPPRGARTLEVNLRGTDDVGNEGAATRLIRLR